MSLTSISKGRSSLLQLVNVCSLERSPFKYLDDIKTFLSGFFPSVEFRAVKTVFPRLTHKRRDELALRLAASRVKDPARRTQEFEPLFGEVDFERRTITGEASPSGVVYDGRKLQDILAAYMTPKPSRTAPAIVLTDRLVSTYSEDDLRHHLRTAVFGLPSLVSVPGVVEAPAKPREYYLVRQELELRGASGQMLDILRRSFEERYIEYGDPRIVGVLQGLALQALLYHLTLEPFCDDRTCRLYNAHWQEELIRSQVTTPRLCARHARLLKRLARSPVVIW